MAAISEVESLTWPEFAARLVSTPPESDDKASLGWYCTGAFDPVYRDSANLQHRECLTLDYDRITPEDVKTIQTAYSELEYAIYTTWSHSVEKPRIRVVLPLSRPATPDEFCAVSRRIAEWAGIELASRESHVPAQMMFLPLRKPGNDFRGRVHPGAWVNVDAVLASYVTWTDKTQWPHRSDGDSTHHAATAERPTDKVGIVGDFCRAFDIPAAIERFQLPYERTDDPDRWTYTAGSRPEGAILYDGAQKLHSHHDTDPARGQHNSFDLVRLHRFSALDPVDTSDSTPIGELPSFRAMAVLVNQQPEVRAGQAANELDDLGPLPANRGLEVGNPEAGAQGLARHIRDVLRTPTIPRWLLTDRIEHGVIAVMAGPRGSYKSFLALDWGLRCAQLGHIVYAVSAEGGDFDRRAKAWIKVHGNGDDSLPLYVVERRLDLSSKEGIETIRGDCVRLNIKPDLFILDTFSKLSGGLDENDNSEVKQFIGRLDNGLKRAETGFDATVLLIAHTGHSDVGRPRGASALAADTDAEYIVARSDDGAVSITRERFKSSPELSPLIFRPEIVKLGYVDTNGAEITSLVLRASDEAPTKRKTAAVGKNQRAIFGECVEALAQGPKTLTELIEILAAKRQPPLPGEKDRRPFIVNRAIGALVDAGVLFRKDDRMSTKAFSNAAAVSDEEFDTLPERSV